MTIKTVLATAAATGVLLVSALPAFAAGSADSHASDCGATHGAFADQNGNFGWLGPLRFGVSADA